MQPSDFFLGLVTITSLATMFGAGVAWGMNKKTVAAQDRRIAALEKSDVSLEDSIDRLDAEVTKLTTLLTGATGNNGLLGDLRSVKEKVENISDLVIAMATKMEIPIRRGLTS